MTDTVNVGSDYQEENPKEEFLKFFSNLANWVDRQFSLLNKDTIDGSSDIKRQDNDIDITDSQSLGYPQTYFSVLDSQLNKLPQRDKARMSDDEKNMILQLFMRLRSLYKRVNKWGDIQKSVKQGTMDLLSDFSFSSFKSLEEFKNFIEENSESTSWNNLMLEKFLSWLFTYLDWSENSEKSRILIRVFEIPWVRGCSWNTRMLQSLQSFVNTVDGSEKWSILRRFNALPHISKLTDLDRVWKQWAGLRSSNATTGRLWSKPFASVAPWYWLWKATRMYPYK